MDPTLRFSSRAENYVKYRPGYPTAILDTLRAECHLQANSVVADIGSGTGKLAELFLRNGNRVYGVEPNPQMRAAAERLFTHYPKFTSVAARAEFSTLPDHCADFVTAGQAFHWFDLELARSEFTRILKWGGWVVLIWNERKKTGTPFREAYETLLVHYDQDESHQRVRNPDLGAIRNLFARDTFRFKSFPNFQILDWEGLKGRLMSASYIPEPGHPAFPKMINELQEIFSTHQEEGSVRFEYDTRMYYGRLMEASSREGPADGITRSY